MSRVLLFALIFCLGSGIIRANDAGTKKKGIKEICYDTAKILYVFERPYRIYPLCEYHACGLGQLSVRDKVFV